MMRKHLRKIILLLIIFSSSTAFACSCIGKNEVKEEINKSDYVFTGKIISKKIIQIKDPARMNMLPGDSLNFNDFPYVTKIATYKMKVLILYKGKLKTNVVEIVTGLGNGDCGIRFKLGEKYIIYGFNKTYMGQENNNFEYPENDNIVYTHRCLRTTQFNQHEIAEIEKFRKKRKRI